MSLMAMTLGMGSPGFGKVEIRPRARILRSPGPVPVLDGTAPVGTILRAEEAFRIGRGQERASEEGERREAEWRVAVADWLVILPCGMEVSRGVGIIEEEVHLDGPGAEGVLEAALEGTVGPQVRDSGRGNERRDLGDVFGGEDAEGEVAIMRDETAFADGAEERPVHEKRANPRPLEGAGYGKQVLTRRQAVLS